MFEKFVTILTVSVDNIGVLSFQLVSILGKLVTKFKSFFSEELKIPYLHFNAVYAPNYS